MTSKMKRLSTIGLMLAIPLVITSCSTESDAWNGRTTALAAYRAGIPGGVIVETFTTTATVTAIDAANRKVTLESPEGKTTTATAGPNAINFDQVRVGDQLTFRVAQEFVAYLVKDGVPPTDSSTTMMELAPKGAKPGGTFTTVVQITGKVTHLNVKKHEATIELSTGRTRTFKVRPDVDLSQRRVGDELVVRCTQVMALKVSKPHA
jgi:hypothetical protein